MSAGAEDFQSYLGFACKIITPYPSWGPFQHGPVGKLASFKLPTQHQNPFVRVSAQELHP